MRTIIYAIFNTDTNERVFTSTSIRECERKLAELNGNHVIRHKWMSI
jgi:hypothetical protein